MSSVKHAKDGDDGDSGMTLGNGRRSPGESWMFKTKENEWKYEEKVQKEEEKEKKEDPYSEIEHYLRKAE
ncbi:hypothetical protein SK128_000802, partial [Halocaridina rubra]